MREGTYLPRFGLLRLVSCLCSCGRVRRRRVRLENRNMSNKMIRRYLVSLVCRVFGHKWSDPDGKGFHVCLRRYCHSSYDDSILEEKDPLPPDLPPAYPPEGYKFYVSPDVATITIRLRKHPRQRVLVYLLKKETSTQGRSHEELVSTPGCIYHTTWWVEKDPEQTKAWINLTFHQLLRRKQELDLSQKVKDELCGEYPPKQPLS